MFTNRLSAFLLALVCLTAAGVVAQIAPGRPTDPTAAIVNSNSGFFGSAGVCGTVAAGANVEAFTALRASGVSSGTISQIRFVRVTVTDPPATLPANDPFLSVSLGELSNTFAYDRVYARMTGQWQVRPPQGCGINCGSADDWPTGPVGVYMNNSTAALVNYCAAFYF